jgi:glyoxylase-like metal-dependent hydrolase (beta-lactamase superfamily II)
VKITSGDQPSASFAPAGGKTLPFHREMSFEYGVLQDIAPGVRRLVCPNASPFTFKGTNTYVIGQGEVAVIDPGPDAPEHIANLLSELSRGGEAVTQILITHVHSDHSGGALHLHHATGAPIAGRTRTGAERQEPGRSPSGKSFLTVLDYHRELSDGDVIEGAGFELVALHTPGHAPDHMCYRLNSAPILFSGDHVMGWNTTVIAPPEGHMGSYIRSLEKLLAGTDVMYLPGHGGAIDEPQRFVKALIMHRRWREAEIAECLRTGFNTIDLIVPRIYGQLESALSGAAALAVFAQIELMIEKGIVATETRQKATMESAFVLTG